MSFGNFAKTVKSSMIRIPPEDLTFIQVLGKGGCGEVHLAESKTLGKVAVKKTLLGGEEEVMQEFLNETELLSRMNSPYIIRFFGTSRNKEGECIVMEYATNGTLFHFLELLRKRKIESTFSWDKRYQMAQDITRGLLLMHSQRVLHRDLKSLNILLDDNMRAKISDFGLSKIKTKSQTTSSSLYVQNNVFGSLFWKAPETFSIKNPYTDKADIYALGIVFWEIASCQVPYEGFDAETIKDSVKSGERLDIPSNCPVEFKELIELCWNQEHKQRPTASIVFDKISQIIGQIPKFDSDYITSSVPQFSGRNPDPVITIQEAPKTNIIFARVDPNRFVTDNQSVQNNGESEIERKIRLAQEKQLFLLMEKKKREEEEQKRKQEAIEKENQRIEIELMEEQKRKMKAEEERIQKEKRLQEELERTKREVEERKMKAEEERKKREEEQRKKKEEEKRKIEEEQKRRLYQIEKENQRIEKELSEEQDKKKKAEEETFQKKMKGGDPKEKLEYERIGKWKSTKASDFEGNIFEAAKDGKLTSVIYLLANGTNVNSKDHLNNGWHYRNSIALHYAAQQGHLSVVEYLVNQKADINAKTQKDSTPLHYAAQNGYLNVVEYLVNQKADINAKDEDNSTPLHKAAWNGYLSVVECLVNQKADINAKGGYVGFSYLIGLLFIGLLNKVIIVLLNV